MKKPTIVSILVFSCLSLASAKSYDITLTSPTKAGSVELKAGQYRLKIEGTNATFVDADSGKSFTTPVKVETSDKKFDQTSVDTTKGSGTDVLKDIEFGGSKTKIEFGQ
jgi:hypothetical protein